MYPSDAQLRVDAPAGIHAQQLSSAQEAHLGPRGGAHSARARRGATGSGEPDNRASGRLAQASASAASTAATVATGSHGKAGAPARDGHGGRQREQAAFMGTSSKCEHYCALHPGALNAIFCHSL